MSQGPIPVYSQYAGGNLSKLNVAAAVAVKATPGNLKRIVVVVAPSAGNLTVNDLATTSGDAAANRILNTPFGSLTVGQVIVLDWPCLTGIAITSVGTGGVYSVAYA